MFDFKHAFLVLIAASTILVVTNATFPINCALVLCAKPTCRWPIPANPIKGRCCPTCPLPTEPPTLDCRLVRCGKPNCPRPLPPPKGQCCPVCPDPPTEPPTLDCRLVRCAKPKCSNPIPPPKGQCCPTCPSCEDKININARVTSIGSEMLIKCTRV